MRRKRPELSDWQKQLVGELETLAQQHPAEIRVIEQPNLAPDGTVVVGISLRTVDIPREPGGLELEDDQEFVLQISPSLLVPPNVYVDHVRFLGFPHVLQGYGLCIYL